MNAIDFSLSLCVVRALPARVQRMVAGAQGFEIFGGRDEHGHIGSVSGASFSRRADQVRWVLTCVSMAIVSRATVRVS